MDSPDDSGVKELRANAMLAEMAAQRNAALDRCALLAAELAVALAAIPKKDAAE